MSKKNFSKSFKTFGEWFSQGKDTPYRGKILRLHTLHPQASLSQLRRHARKGERALGQIKRIEPSKIGWDDLSPREMDTREKSLKVLGLMKNKGYSLSKASRIMGISPDTVKRHTNALKKSGPRWTRKRYDTISRIMSINERGRSIWIEIDDSRYASMIGRYHNAVKQYLEKNDPTYLQPFVGKKVKDSDGVWHTLETDPRTLYEINERRPHEEFIPIYKPQDAW